MQAPNKNLENSKGDEGFIAIERRFFTGNAYWLESRELGGAYMDLLQLAAYKPHTVTRGGAKVDLVRGQMCESQRTLAREWGWGRPRVQRFLNRLTRDGHIDREEAGTERTPDKITMLRYEEYVRFDAGSRRSTSNPPATGDTRSTLHGGESAKSDPPLELTGRAERSTLERIETNDEGSVSKTSRRSVVDTPPSAVEGETGCLSHTERAGVIHKYLTLGERMGALIRGTKMPFAAEVKSWDAFKAKYPSMTDEDVRDMLRAIRRNNELWPFDKKLSFVILMANPPIVRQARAAIRERERQTSTVSIRDVVREAMAGIEHDGHPHKAA